MEARSDAERLVGVESIPEDALSSERTNVALASAVVDEPSRLLHAVDDQELPTMPAAEDAEAVLAFEGVSRHWGRGKRRWAVLRDVDLRLPPGSATRISGRNGAGKTTLLRIASGILAADEGTVTLDGITPTANWRRYHREIGFLSAGDRGLYARVSVREHLMYVAALSFIPRSERREVVDSALSRFALAELAGRRADRLSQGQRQRLRLALTLLHRPRVILLDEPRNSLDAEGLEMLGSVVKEALAHGGVILWVAPAGEEQPIEFDRDFMIDDGRLIPA